jgi:NTE family protein
VGIVRYVLEQVSRALGRPVPIDVLSGTSAGSINALMLAAHADKPAERGAMLAQQWTNLDLEDIVRPSVREMLHVDAIAGRGARQTDGERRHRGGI